MVNNRPYLEISKDELNFQEPLGRGAQGAVFKALWKTKHQIVAVKHVFEFDPELEVLQRIQHKHVIQFIGAVDEEHFKAIVIEYAEHGSLYQFNKTNPPDFEQLLIWSRHIALGLNYLHNGLSPRIIHRDLKSRNVVIDSNRIAKICDFGSSRSLDRTYTKFSRLHGTVAWMAPEVMRNHEVSEKCDTYSFAMLLWELITGKTPFEGEEEPQIMFGVCQYKRRPPIPASCPEEFARLIRDCWADDANERPSVEGILHQLNAMLGNITLTEQVDCFLSARQSWSQDFERQIQVLKEEFQQKEMVFQEQLNAKDNQIQIIKNKINRSPPPSAEGGIGNWTESDVTAWLNSEFYDPQLDYSSAFLSNHITGPRLLQLTDLDLTKMGIASLGHRKEIIESIWILEQKIISHENYPPLMGCCKPLGGGGGRGGCGGGGGGPAEKGPSKSTGTSFTLSLTYGNNFYSTSKLRKWNLFLFVEGDNIATKSIKCVEFRIDSGDVIKKERPPWVMDDFRFEKPQGKVECKLYFKGNVLKPKTWSAKFGVVFDKGGFMTDREIEVCLNEDQIPSTVPSLTSSISSFNSFSMKIDSWQTTPMGAWAAGPPASILRSPVSIRPPGWTNRRASSPFSASPISSPISKRKGSAAVSYNNKLNNSISSPGKLNMLNRSRDGGKATRDFSKRDLPHLLSFQYEDRESTDPRTPTHDPKNPRFTSPRNSLVEASQQITLTRNNLSFGTYDSAELNMNFASAHTTKSEDGFETRADDRELIERGDDRELTPKKRGISISSTLTSNSDTGSVDIVAKLEDMFPANLSGSGETAAPEREWYDRAAWGVSSNSNNAGTSPRNGDISPPPTGRTVLTPLPKQANSLNLARSGKLSYADILSTASPAAPARPPPQPTVAPQSAAEKTRRLRKDSSGSASSDKRGTRRRGRGSTRGRGGRGGGNKGSFKYHSSNKQTNKQTEKQ